MGKNSNNRAQKWKAKKNNNGSGSGKATASIAESSATNDFGRCKFATSQLMKDVATLRFNVPAGDRFRGVSDGNVVVPSILALPIMPTPGISRDYLSPINNSSRKFFAQVRKANSGKVNYEAEDLMTCMYALDSIFMFHTWGTRAYATLLNYSRENRAIPQGLVQAMGFDYADLVKNMASFRAYLNMFSSKVAAAVVPKDIPYFSRHIWMMSNMFKDADSDKATLYLYRPAGFFKYVEMYEGPDYTGCKLDWYVPNALATESMTVDDYIEAGDELLEQLIRSYDIDIMSGDLIRAYGDQNVFRIAQISEDMSVSPIYDVEELAVIQNATIHSMPLAATASVTQDPLTQALLFDPEFNLPVIPEVVESDRLLNVYNLDAPTADEVLRITRLMNTCQIVPGINGAKSDTYKLTDCGSEIVVNAKLYYMKVDEHGNRSPVMGSYPIRSWITFNVDSTDQNQNYQHMLNMVAMLSRCDFHPYVNIVAYSRTDLGSSYAYGLQNQFYIGDICNATVLDSEALHMMHETILLAQFDVPAASNK